MNKEKSDFTEEYLNITEEIDNFIGGLSNVVFQV